MKLTTEPLDKKTIKKNIKEAVKEAPALSTEEVQEEKSKYTRVMNLPIYEPCNTKPLLEDLLDTTKRDELIGEIDADEDIPDDLRAFLKSAAERHTSFNFAKVADYYSHLDPRFKCHFENSALVIIDYDNAIRNGFISYDKEVQESRIDYLENIISVEKLAENKEEVRLKRLQRAEEELQVLKDKDIKKNGKQDSIIDDEEW